MDQEPKLIDAVAQPILSVRAKVKMEEIPSFKGRAFGEVAVYMQRKGIQMIGPPFSIYHSWSATETDVESGFSVARQEKGEERVRASILPSGKVATITHIGPYEDLTRTYSRLEKWMKSKGYEPAYYMWETYLNSPQEVPPEKLMTQMFWPIK